MKATDVITLIATILTAGWFSTVIVQAIKRPSWPSWLREVLAVVVALLIGLATAWLNGSVLQITLAWERLSTTDLFAFGVAVYATASTWYHHYLSGAGWMQTLAAK